MHRRLAAVLVLLGLAGCATPSTHPAPAQRVETVPFPAAAAAREPGGESGWQLVWNDEFDAPGIDRAKWGYDVDCWGGGNNERQCYTADPRNAAIEDGRLVITARREAASGPAWPAQSREAKSGSTAQASKPFTSARLVTRGHAAWTYGRIEVRARLPQGQGTWPAIWMLPEDGTYGQWAASGEIDILEAVNLGVACATCSGGREQGILGTLHFGGAAPGNAFDSTQTQAPGVLDGFHTFGVVWSPRKIEWTYDGRVYASTDANRWWTSATGQHGAPFDRPFHLIVNLAIGGKLAEGRNLKGVDEAGFPKRFEIDWVRVWKCAPDGASGKTCAGSS